VVPQRQQALRLSSDVRGRRHVARKHAEELAQLVVQIERARCTGTLDSQLAAAASFYERELGYRLEKGTLVTCSTGWGKARPTEFRAAEPAVPYRQPSLRAASVGLIIVLVVALAVGTRLTMSSGGWLGPGRLIESATGASALPAQYGGCADGPPSFTAEGASFRVQGEVHNPSGWWCQTWRGTDVGAVQARLTMHSGAAAYLVVWTPDGRGGYYAGLRADGAYTIERNTDGVRLRRDGFSPSISSGLHQPNVVTVVDRDDTVHLYVNGAHIDAVKHRTLRGGTVGVGIANSTNPVDVAFDDVTIWSH